MSLDDTRALAFRSIVSNTQTKVLMIFRSRLLLDLEHFLVKNCTIRLLIGESPPACANVFARRTFTAMKTATDKFDVHLHLSNSEFSFHWVSDSFHGMELTINILSHEQLFQSSAKYLLSVQQCFPESNAQTKVLTFSSPVPCDSHRMIANIPYQKFRNLSANCERLRVCKLSLFIRKYHFVT